jgi:hypothetical protein
VASRLVILDVLQLKQRGLVSSLPRNLNSPVRRAACGVRLIAS